MSKTVYYAAMSLDGYIADSEDGLAWLLGYEGSFDGDGLEPGPMVRGGAYDRFYSRVGAMVSGSVSYEFVLDHSPADDPWPYAGKPYWVLSSRELRMPNSADADIRVRNAPVADLLDDMRASAGDGDLWIIGGGNVASQFVEVGCLDEVHVTVVPVVLGTGKPLFEEPLADSLQLLGTTAFGNGMVELRYARSGSD